MVISVLQDILLLFLDAASFDAATYIGRIKYIKNLNWLDDDTIVLTGNNSSTTAWTIGMSIAVTPAFEIHIESSTLTIMKPSINLSNRF